jgi:hypothetical protein
MLLGFFGFVLGMEADKSMPPRAWPEGSRGSKGLYGRLVRPYLPICAYLAA